MAVFEHCGSHLELMTTRLHLTAGGKQTSRTETSVYRDSAQMETGGDKLRKEEAERYNQRKEETR